MVETKTLDSATLRDWLAQGKEITVLDVRPDSERNEWSIPESIYFNAYEKLKENDRHALDSLVLSKELPVITVCARGRMSLVAAELLSNKGYNAYSLKGGMNAWNYAWDTSELILGNTKIIQIRRLVKGCLSYLIGSEHQAMVIDASLDPSVYQQVAQKEGWAITFVADTHIHADYVSRTRELATATGAKHIMMASSDVLFSFTPIEDGEEIQVGSTTIKALHTPGHTWESTSFLIKSKVILTGDTLFIDGIGRPDLKANEEEAKRKAEALYDSLQALLNLKEDILVMPAHISESVKVGQSLISAPIKELKKLVAALSLLKEEFISNTLSKLPASPANYLTIAEINKSGNRKDFIIADLETGANRCAVK